MGISIYYDAVRNYPLTCDENSFIGKIVEKYNKEKPFENGEDFCIYEYDTKEPELIFSGATGLPLSDNAMETVEGCYYWAKCLTEIKKIAKDAKWTVQMDDMELTWDDEKGWRHEMFDCL